MAKERRARSSDDEGGGETDLSPAKRMRLEGAVDASNLTQRARDIGRPAARTATDAASDVDEEGQEEVEHDDEAGSDWALDDQHIGDEEAREVYERSLVAQSHSINDKYSENAGWIKEIRLVDFMCHRNLTVSFSKNLNFVVGHNGSGKSAVLTALAVVFGGKTALTGRGSGLKELIRGQEERAQITVTLCNKGYNAYQPDVYGEEIVIERILTRKGGSQYKFRAVRDGKILGNKKAELDRICSAFVIDVDQPLTILTQDAAKTFLSSSDEGALYKFFLEGTNLRQTMDMYQQASAACEVVKRNNVAIAKALPDKITRHRQLERRKAQHQLLNDQNDRSSDLDKERAWALIRDKEKERDERQRDVDSYEDLLRDQQDQVKALENEAIPLTEELEKMEADLGDFRASRDKIASAVREAKIVFEELNRASVDFEDAIDDNRHAIDNCKTELTDLECHIAEKRRALDEGDESRKYIETQDKIREYEKRLSQITESLRHTERDIDRLQIESNGAETARDSAASNITRCNKQREDHEQEIKRLRAQSSDNLSRFGDNIRIVMQEIEREKWQGAKPRLIGQHVRLSNTHMRAKTLFASILGGLLCSFVVQTHQDRVKLQSIVERAAAKGYRPRTGARIPTIIQFSGDIFDYSSGDLAKLENERLSTLMSALEFDDEGIRRVLINAAQIERQFYTQDQGLANEEVKRLVRLNLGHNAIVFSSNSSSKITGRGLDNVDFEPVESRRELLSLFSADVTHELRQEEERLVKARKDGEEARAEHEEAAGRHKDLKVALAAAKTKFAREQTGIRQFNDGIAKLQDLLETRPSTELDALETRRKETESALEANQLQLKLGLERQSKHAEKVTTAKTKYDECQAQKDTFMEERQRKQETLMMATQQRAQKMHDIGQQKKRADILSKKLEDSRATLVQCDVDLREWTVDAVTISPIRVQTERTVEELTAEIKALRKQIADASRREAVDINQLRAEIAKLAREITDAEASLKSAEAIHKYLHESLQKRGLFWNAMRVEAAVRARVIFLHKMEMRSFTGRISFDHQASKLSMGVKTNNTAADGGHSQYKTAKLLSGGERSYSTVSLLLALWETSSGPLRCLDEWDVFLDPVNRSVAAEMLLQGAEQSVGKQFLLITPQAMGNIQIDWTKHRQIKMADPDRNQGSLPYVST